MLQLRHTHSWHVTPAEAVQIQERLRGLVIQSDGLPHVRAVAGLDVGLRGERARAAAVVFSYPQLELVEEAGAELAIEFPYVPGLLTFREGPAALEALSRLKEPWDALICDGQGYAHPRRLGLASHLGVLLDRPTIGCAKSRLIGTHDEVGRAKGSQTALLVGSEVVGAVVRTRDDVKPVYVSAGHRIDLARAIELVLCCTTKYRLPEPTRRAHQVASGRRP